MKISTILANVEYQKEGWSDSKSFDDWKEFFSKQHAEEDRKKQLTADNSAVKTALGKLQDTGLGQKLPDLPTATIVAAPKK